MRHSRAPGVRTPTSGVLMEALFAASVLTGAAVSALAVALGRTREPQPSGDDSVARASSGRHSSGRGASPQ